MRFPASAFVLTAKQVAIVRLAAAGYTNSVIAAQVGTSKSMVKRQLNQVYRKLRFVRYGSSNRILLAIIAHELSLSGSPLANGAQRDAATRARRAGQVCDPVKHAQAGAA